MNDNIYLFFTITAFFTEWFQLLINNVLSNFDQSIMSRVSFWKSKFQQSYLLLLSDCLLWHPNKKSQIPKKVPNENSDLFVNILFPSLHLLHRPILEVIYSSKVISNGMFTFLVIYFQRLHQWFSIFKQSIKPCVLS